MAFQIKEMKPEDSKKIQDFSEFDDFWTITIFEQDCKEQDSIYYQAVEDGKIVGILGIKKILDVIEIMDIAVRKDRRRQGIGTKMLEFLLQQIEENEVIQKIELEVNEKNRAAIHLYETHGFKRVGRRTCYYNHQDDAILMNFEKENSKN